MAAETSRRPAPPAAATPAPTAPAAPAASVPEQIEAAPLLCATRGHITVAEYEQKEASCSAGCSATLGDGSALGCVAEGTVDGPGDESRGGSIPVAGAVGDGRVTKDLHGRMPASATATTQTAESRRRSAGAPPHGRRRTGASTSTSSSGVEDPRSRRASFGVDSAGHQLLRPRVVVTGPATRQLRASTPRRSRSRRDGRVAKSATCSAVASREATAARSADAEGLALGPGATRTRCPRAARLLPQWTTSTARSGGSSTGSIVMPSKSMRSCVSGASRQPRRAGPSARWARPWLAPRRPAARARRVRAAVRGGRAASARVSATASARASTRAPHPQGTDEGHGELRRRRRERRSHAAAGHRRPRRSLPHAGSTVARGRPGRRGEPTTCALRAVDDAARHHPGRRAAWRATLAPPVDGDRKDQPPVVVGVVPDQVHPPPGTRSVTDTGGGYVRRQTVGKVSGGRAVSKAGPRMVDTGGLWDGSRPRGRSPSARGRCCAATKSLAWFPIFFSVSFRLGQRCSLSVGGLIWGGRQSTTRRTATRSARSAGCSSCSATSALAIVQDLLPRRRWSAGADERLRGGTFVRAAARSTSRNSRLHRLMPWAARVGKRCRSCSASSSATAIVGRNRREPRRARRWNPRDVSSPCRSSVIEDVGVGDAFRRSKGPLQGRTWGENVRRGRRASVCSGSSSRCPPISALIGVGRRARNPGRGGVRGDRRRMAGRFLLRP